MTNFWYRLGKSSLEKAQEAALTLHPLGKVVPYLGPEALNDPEMRFSLWIMVTKSNIEYIRTRQGIMGSVKIAFLKAMIQSNRLALTESELEKYMEKEKEELDLLGEEL
ncbi:MAG: hypothetical protein J7L82_02350 [Staphylothermus sp.]|nr:hypothetical protein [Staphylothermus sp.]